MSTTGTPAAKKTNFLHNGVDEYLLFRLCYAPEPLFKRTDWMPLSCVAPALAKARALPERGFDWPAGVYRRPKEWGFFDEVQAVTFRSAARCGARIFYVTMRHTLLRFPATSRPPIASNGRSADSQGVLK